MYYKKFIDENSKYIKIDNEHTCTEEQLHAFMGNMFKFFERITILNDNLTLRLTKRDRKSQSIDFEQGFFFDEALHREYDRMWEECVHGLLNNICEFKEDTQNE